MEVHQCLNVFELWILDRPAPIVDVTAPQAAVEILREDLDTILEAWVPESEAPSVERAEDTVLATLFSTSTMPPPAPWENAKRHHAIYEEEPRSWKKELLQLEAARRASLIDEEACQLRDIELVAEGLASEFMWLRFHYCKSCCCRGHYLGFPDYIWSRFRAIGPASLLIAGALRLSFASPTTLFYILLCIGEI